MNNYIATFYTHYGALKFHRECAKSGIQSKQMPVPRKLSSSCGTCVMFAAEDYRPVLKADAEDLENCYLVEGKDVFTATDVAELND